MPPEEETTTTNQTTAPSVETKETVEMVPRSELATAIRARQEAKESARALKTTLEALEEANGGQPLTAEDIARFKEDREARALAEEEALKKKGDFEELQQRQAADHKAALDERDARYSGLFGHYSGKELKLKATELLAEQDVLPSAVKTARKALIDGDDKQGVRMEFAEVDGSYVVRLVDSAGRTAMDPKTGDSLTEETYTTRFKENHPYLFKREVSDGSGSGSDSELTAEETDHQKQIQIAIDTGDQELYRKHRKALGFD